LALNRPGDAVRAYQQAVRLSPWDFDAAYQSGTLLCQLRRFDEALSCLDLCDRLLPDHAATHQMRALALYGLKRFEDGLAEIRRAHALEPNNADVCNNIGVFLRRLGREDEALPWFDQAVKLRPDSLVFFENKAIALCNMHRFTEAIAAFNDMKAVDPVQAEYNIAFVQLLLGNFELGWVGRESRWRIPGMQISLLTFSEPMWLGKEPIAGKTILVYSDEGLGDTIQFVRYAPMVAARGAKVILMVQDALYPLLWGLPCVAQCLPRSAETLPRLRLPMPPLYAAAGLRYQARHHSGQNVLFAGSHSGSHPRMGGTPRCS
jgi:tetratricopeptide (TPR) repeat protein